MLANIWDDPANGICVDCDGPEPVYLCVTLGVLVCDGCATIHRTLGHELADVASVQLDVLVKTLAKVGNAQSKAYFEANVPVDERFRSAADGEDRSREGKSLATWIHDKYVARRFVPQGLDEPWMCSGDGEMCPVDGKKDKKDKKDKKKDKKERKSKKELVQQQQDEVGDNILSLFADVADAFAPLGEWAASPKGLSGLYSPECDDNVGTPQNTDQGEQTACAGQPIEARYTTEAAGATPFAPALSFPPLISPVTNAPPTDYSLAPASSDKRSAAAQDALRARIPSSGHAECVPSSSCDALPCAFGSCSCRAAERATALFQVARLFTAAEDSGLPRGTRLVMPCGFDLLAGEFERQALRKGGAASPSSFQVAYPRRRSGSFTDESSSDARRRAPTEICSPRYHTRPAVDGSAVHGPRSPRTPDWRNSSWEIDQSACRCFREIFVSMRGTTTGVLEASEAEAVFQRSQLPAYDLSIVWALVDPGNTRRLPLDAFVTAMHLISRRRKGSPFPVTVPSDLIRSVARWSSEPQTSQPSTRPSVPSEFAPWPPTPPPTASATSGPRSPEFAPCPSPWSQAQSVSEASARFGSLRQWSSPLVQVESELSGRPGLRSPKVFPWAAPQTFAWKSPHSPHATTTAERFGQASPQAEAVRSWLSGPKDFGMSHQPHGGSTPEDGAERCLFASESLDSQQGIAPQRRDDLAWPTASVRQPTQQADSLWMVTPRMFQRYLEVFRAMDVSGLGRISRNEAIKLLSRSEVPTAELDSIWHMSDVDQDGALSLPEFVAALHITARRREGAVLPSQLPKEFASLSG